MIQIFVESWDSIQQGDGPIITATEWSCGPALDQAGSFTFKMPASDPRAALLLPRLRVRAVQWLDGVKTELGWGIIESIAQDASDTAMLTITGGDQLRELAGIPVLDLELVNLVSRSPDHFELVAGGYQTLPVTVTLSDTVWLYIHDADTYRTLAVTVVAPVNASRAEWEYQYYNADTHAWEQLPISSNTTIAGGFPFGQSGSITWDEPSGWGNTEHHNGFYIVRMRPLGGSCSIRFTGASIYSHLPVSDALNTLIALSDISGDGLPDWDMEDSGSYYSSTAGTVYRKFSDESLLSALNEIATNLGEHFFAEGRFLRWLRTGAPSSGIRAVMNVDAEAVADEPDFAIITALSETRDTADLLGGIYPLGGGQGEKRVTLAATDRTLPAGFEYITSGGVKIGIKHTATESWAGVLRRRMQKSEIVARTAGALQMRNAANALCDWALNYLRTHCAATAAAVPKFYKATLIKVRRPLFPGMTIRVVAQQYRDTVRFLNIDADLRVLSLRRRWTATNPEPVVEVELGTVDRMPAGDVGMLVNGLQQATADRAQTLTPEGATFIATGGLVKSMTLQDGRIKSVSVKPGYNGNFSWTRDQDVTLTFENGQLIAGTAS